MSEPKPTTQKPVTLVTMTSLRRHLADLAEQAAAGETVVITKSGIPYLQLIPVKHEYHAPLIDPIDLGEIATATTDELVARLNQARQQGNETVSLAILAELGERTAREHMTAAFTQVQEG